MPSSNVANRGPSLASMSCSNAVSGPTPEDKRTPRTSGLPREVVRQSPDTLDASRGGLPWEVLKVAATLVWSFSPVPSLARRRIESKLSTGGWAAVSSVARTDPPQSSGYSLSQDWPEAEHHEPATQLGQAFEAEYAPDAFGVQLLGAGYEGRIPTGSDWTSTPVADGGVIVEHRDPAAWYGRLLMPFGGHPNYTQPPKPPVPNVLAQARRDFSEILFRDEIAWQSHSTGSRASLE